MAWSGGGQRVGRVLYQSCMKSAKRSLHYDSLLLPLTRKKQACLIPRDLVRNHFKHLSNDDLSSFLQMQDAIPINFARVAVRRNIQNAILAARSIASDASEDSISTKPVCSDSSQNYNVKMRQSACSDPSHNYNAAETRVLKTNLDILCELAADRKPSQ